MTRANEPLFETYNGSTACAALRAGETTGYPGISFYSPWTGDTIPAFENPHT